MLCRDIMKTDVERVSARTPIKEVARKMRDRNVGFLPVCDESWRVLGTITDRDIANLVHRNTPHPAGTRVRRIGPLLVHNGCAIGVAYLIPSHGRNSRCVVRLLTAGVHGVVDNQRLVVAKIPVGQSVHQPVANRVELLAGPRLRDAGPSSAGLVE